jgi:hypothetical protein
MAKQVHPRRIEVAEPWLVGLLLPVDEVHGSARIDGLSGLANKSVPDGKKAAGPMADGV